VASVFGWAGSLAFGFAFGWAGVVVTVELVEVDEVDVGVTCVLDGVELLVAPVAAVAGTLAEVLAVPVALAPVPAVCAAVLVVSLVPQPVSAITTAAAISEGTHTKRRRFSMDIVR
jgi:hypothetical protein